MFGLFGNHLLVHDCYLLSTEGEFLFRLGAKICHVESSIYD